MAKLKWSVIHQDQTVAASSEGTDHVSFLYKEAYQEGDQICLETDSPNRFYVIQVDDAMGKSFVYLTTNTYIYRVPFGEKRVCYSPKVFSGEMHLLTARLATDEEIAARKNLALNPLDQHGDPGCWPHASANVETRGEATFAARNAIDGILENSSHGKWPYGSWGINKNPEAAWKVELGRPGCADKIVIYLRAAFPHDRWWEQVTLTFSDGTSMKCPLVKTAEGQTIDIGGRVVTWVGLSELIRADDPSPFPALTQLEVYGTEAK